ncbi:MAG: hypothetical protein KGO96_08645 [Elusimicrobia bacterium]|nr:hypothetical protein [Elusimicrobiota bacterium]MDE2236803.1 hypothetical protein [Elusimicrobiota bacterium]MDE2425957.1 hypothetical protein [Elusimicrobiota bacterium]
MKYWMQAVLIAALALCLTPRLRAQDEGEASQPPAAASPSHKDDGAMRQAWQAEREALKPMRRQLRDAVLKLRDQLQDNASDQDLLASMSRVKQARSALQEQREKFLEEHFTVKQRAQMMVRMARRGQQAMGHGRRMRQGQGRRPMRAPQNGD